MRKQKPIFFILFIIIAALGYLAFFGLKIGSFEIKGANQMRYGIDIRGGVEAYYVPKGDIKPTDDQLDSARSIIETRLDAQNISDREVSVDRENSMVLVRFPWKSDEAEFDAQKAISELGETAELTFRDPDNTVVIEGKDVKKATAEYQQASSTQINSGGYVVRLELNEEGAVKFEEATGRLINQRISIYMDENIISAPTVNDKISGGSAVINGMENMQAAKDLADKINSGALPFAMESKNNSIISPTLGENALHVMVMAGILAFALVCLFMLTYYRLPGFVACLTLALQTIGQLLALSVPQYTLTLPGIAAIILSIGMGVDANVIIAERIKEEINLGKSLRAAIDTGFHRAFSSVFDGNITVIIVAVILMILGSGSIQSFGYSLLTGVIMNFIAGVTVTRLMIKSLSAYKGLQNIRLYGARRVKND